MRVPIYDLPDEHYEEAEFVADSVQPAFAALIQMFATKYDNHTALGIGSAAMVFMMAGLSDTCDELSGLGGRDQSALEEFVGAITDAINRRVERARARASGELN